MKLILLVFIFLPVVSYAPEDGFLHYKKFYPQLNRPLFNIVKEAGSKYKIRRSVILSIINAESEFNRFAFSSSKARGLMQIMAFNYKGNPQDLYDPYINILTGTRIFREYLDLAKSDYGVALKNYNSGPNSKYYNLEYIRKVLMYVKKVDPVFAIFEMESSIDFLNL